MAKIHFTSEGLFAKTPCPFGIRSGYSTTMVNSHRCVRCKYYRSTNHKEKYVICLADCSSYLEDILNKIDLVIANDKYDDIVFEEFLGEIREDIASVLDGTNNK